MRKAIRGCTPWSSGCHHLLEGVPYIFSLLSSSRLQAVVAVGTLCDSADDTTHRAVLFPHVHFDIRVARTPKWVNFFVEKQTRPVSHGTAQRFQEDWIRSPCLSRRKPSCLRCVHPFLLDRTPWRGMS